MQILRKLVKHGLLESTCGVAGGYFLARSPQQISLRDIVEAFENPLEVLLPALETVSAGTRSRILQSLDAASKAAGAELQKLSVADLLRADGVEYLAPATR